MYSNDINIEKIHNEQNCPQEGRGGLAPKIKYGNFCRSVIVGDNVVVIE